MNSVRDIREIASSPQNMYRLYQKVSDFVAATHAKEINVCHSTIHRIASHHISLSLSLSLSLWCLADVLTNSWLVSQRNLRLRSHVRMSRDWLISLSSLPPIVFTESTLLTPSTHQLPSSVWETSWPLLLRLLESLLPLPSNYTTSVYVCNLAGSRMSC
jgi:hypothetical protein